MSKPYDWRFENSINLTKKYEETEGIVEHKYNSWRTNSALSNYLDTIMLVNEMNIAPHLTDKMQYDFLFHSVKAKKRFFKKKKTSQDVNFEIVSDYYKYNENRTKEALSILTKKQIEMIKKKQDKGGFT